MSDFSLEFWMLQIWSASLLMRFGEKVEETTIKQDFFGRTRRSENNIYSSVQVDNLLKKTKAQQGTTVQSSGTQPQQRTAKTAIQPSFQPKKSAGTVSVVSSGQGLAPGRGLRLTGERKSAADMADALTNEYDLCSIQEGDDFKKKSALISKNIVKKAMESRTPSNELRFGERRLGTASMISTIKQQSKQGVPGKGAKGGGGTQLVGPNDMRSSGLGSHYQVAEDKEDGEKVKSARGMTKSPQKYTGDFKTKK